MFLYTICFFLHTDITSTSNFRRFEAHIESNFHFGPPIDIFNHFKAVNNKKKTRLLVYIALADISCLIHMKRRTSFCNVTVTLILQEKNGNIFFLKWHIFLWLKIDRNHFHLKMHTGAQLSTQRPTLIGK